jgi:type IV pilus assembly protein PilC
MTLFRYVAKKGPEEAVEGTVEAATREDAVDLISRKGLFPVTVEAASVGPERVAPGRSGGRVRSRDITVFSRQLGSLLRAGVPLLNALNVISEQTDSPGLRGILSGISEEVREGASLSSAMAEHPKIFPSSYLAVVRAGESSGTLEESLSRIADHRRKQEEILARVRTALVYPAFMLVVGLATMLFMVVFVMPRLTEMFEGLGQKLPLPTRMVVAVGNGIRDYGIWVIPIAAAILLVWRRQPKAEGGLPILDRLKLRLPLLGGFLLKVELARFCRTLEVLVRSGIPVLEALRTAGSVIRNGILREDLRTACEDVERGAPLGRSLRRSGRFPVFMTSLLGVGEESGRLDEALAEVASSYERDTDEAVGTSTSLLEPAMILVIGSIVGFVVLAMLLPIFEMDIMGGM